MTLVLSYNPHVLPGRACGRGSEGDLVLCPLGNAGDYGFYYGSRHSNALRLGVGGRMTLVVIHRRGCPGV